MGSLCCSRTLACLRTLGSLLSECCVLCRCGPEWSRVRSQVPITVIPAQRVFQIACLGMPQEATIVQPPWTGNTFEETCRQ